MSLKNAAFFALIGMTLLNVVLAGGTANFILRRDLRNRWKGRGSQSAQRAKREKP